MARFAGIGLSVLKKTSHKVVMVNLGRKVQFKLILNMPIAMYVLVIGHLKKERRQNQ